MKLEKLRWKARRNSTPAHWRDFLTKLFPHLFYYPLAPHHLDFWGHIDSIQPQVKPSAFFAIWPRGGGKSSNVEAATAFLGVQNRRKFCLYVRSTQTKANESVQNIASILEKLTERKVGKYGNSKGWRIDTLRCANGFNVVALGFDAAVRGIRIEEYRPDLIICHAKGTEILHESEWILVEEHPSARSFIGNGFEVSAWGLPFTEVVSEKHLYWVKQLGYRGKYNTGKLSQKTNDDWLEADLLHDHCYIGTPIDYTVISPPKIPVYVPGAITERNDKGQVVSAGGKYELLEVKEFFDPEWWWFFGLWWGDGHVVGRYRVGITIADTQPDIKGRIISLLDRYGIAFSEFQRPGCSQIMFSRAHLNRWLREWKVNSNQAQKIPPSWVEQIDYKYQKSLINGYIDSDGFIDYKNSQIRITSVSIDGLLSLQRMLARFDIPSMIRAGIKPYQYDINGYTGITQQKYDIQFRQNTKALGYDISDQSRYNYTRVFIQDGYLWRKIREIEPVSEVEFIPIKTDSGKYISHFGLSHNCDDIDDKDDSLVTVEKKVKTLTDDILPAGSRDVAVIGVQNLIHYNSIFKRIADGKADFLHNRIVSGPFPAVIDLEYEARPEGGYRITGGTPTWEGQDLEVCEAQINEWGPDAFLKESQQIVTLAKGRVFHGYTGPGPDAKTLDYSRAQGYWHAHDFGGTNEVWGLFVKIDEIYCLIYEQMLPEATTARRAEMVKEVIGAYLKPEIERHEREIAASGNAWNLANRAFEAAWLERVIAGYGGARGEKQIRADYRGAGLDIQPPNVSAVESQVNTTNEMLKGERGNRVVICSNCVHTIDNLEHCIRDPLGAILNERSFHYAAMLRYFCAGMGGGLHWAH